MVKSIEYHTCKRNLSYDHDSVYNLSDMLYKKQGNRYIKFLILV